MEPQYSNQNNLPEQPTPTSPPHELPPQSIPTTASTSHEDSTPSQSASQISIPTTPQQEPPHKMSQLTERAEKLKRLSIQVMIGSLIGAAALAVIIVLVGSFNETFEKALFTLFLVIVHALACLAFVEQTGKVKQTSFKFFENSVFAIIVLSFFTSIFGTWGLLAGEIVAKLYGTYGILLFACLHGQLLVETRGKQKLIDNIVNANYGFMALVILLILPIIWSPDAGYADFYYRFLAAAGIIDATLTILSVILHKLYIQKHPEIQSNVFGATGDQLAASDQKRHFHPLVWILIILIGGQLVISFLFAALGAFYR